MNIKELAEQAGMLYINYIRVDSMKQIERFAKFVIGGAVGAWVVTFYRK